MADEYIRIAVVAGAPRADRAPQDPVDLGLSASGLKKITKFSYKTTNSYREFTIAGFTPQKGKSGLLQLDGINDRDKALSFKGLDIFIDRNRGGTNKRRAGEDSYYYYDIIGCDVYHATGGGSAP